MEYLSVVLFAIAAVGGLSLASLKFLGKSLPMPLAFAHGAFAAAGLVTLIIRVAGSAASTLLNVSLLLFVIVAAGGFTLFSFHLRKKELPALLIAVHGLGAVVSFVLLLVALLR